MHSMIQPYMVLKKISKMLTKRYQVLTIYLKRLTMIQKLEKLKTKYLVLLVQLILLFLTQKLQIFKAKFLVLLITTNAALNTEADEIKKN